MEIRAPELTQLNENGDFHFNPYKLLNAHTRRRHLSELLKNKQNFSTDLLCCLDLLTLQQMTTAVSVVFFEQ